MVVLLSWVVAQFVTMISCIYPVNTFDIDHMETLSLFLAYTLSLPYHLLPPTKPYSGHTHPPHPYQLAYLFFSVLVIRRE